MLADLLNIGEPVAAVVSGYGLADLATEALGGFFLFGAANSLRHGFEWLDRLRESVRSPTRAPAARARRRARPCSNARHTRTVQAPLSHRR